MTTEAPNRRILIIDDNRAIHDDFVKILRAERSHSDRLEAVETVLFGQPQSRPAGWQYEVDSAFQGPEGLTLVRQALQAGRPYAMAFIDVRMPPGWDGVETTARIWAEYPELQVVICTAYADCSWDEMQARLGSSDRLVILKKPFENIEVLQLAHALTVKWHLARAASRHLEELEHRVSERTRDLQVANARLHEEMQERLRIAEQLQQAQRLETVGQLAAGVAHHFNNILTIVQMHAGLLLEGEHVNAAVARPLQEISQAATRAATLTRQLLAFSRRQLLRPQVLDLAATVERVAHHLRGPEGDRIRLRVEREADTPPVLADRNAVEQVLQNLVANAREAMPQGGEIVMATALAEVDATHARNNPEAREGRFVRLTVSDTGTGMDAATMTRLFEPFFTTREKSQRAGLGLATIYGIVKQHQGWIEVESMIGHGTTFKVFLPSAGGPRSP